MTKLESGVNNIELIQHVLVGNGNAPPVYLSYCIISYKQT